MKKLLFAIIFAVGQVGPAYADLFDSTFPPPLDGGPGIFSTLAITSSADGCLSVGPNYLEVDCATGNVGIGTASPVHKLDVFGSVHASSNGLFDGNIGLGTSNTGTRLTLAKDSVISADGTDGNDIGQLALTGGGALGSVRGASVVLTGNEDAKTGNLDLSAGNVAGGDVTLSAGGAVRLRVLNSGAVHYEPRSTAPTGPSLGDTYVDSDTNEFCFYDGTIWTGLKGAGACS